MQRRKKKVKNKKRKKKKKKSFRIRKHPDGHKLTLNEADNTDYVKSSSHSDLRISHLAIYVHLLKRRSKI